ncbi:hypothetical protein CSUI_011509, partial [Cystoisospora suis]
MDVEQLCEVSGQHRRLVARREAVIRAYNRQQRERLEREEEEHQRQQSQGEAFHSFSSKPLEDPKKSLGCSLHTMTSTRSQQEDRHARRPSPASLPGIGGGGSCGNERSLMPLDSSSSSLN